MKMTRMILTCNRDWCDYQETYKAHVVPERIWHEYEHMGQKEQHLCTVEVEEDE